MRCSAPTTRRFARGARAFECVRRPARRSPRVVPLPPSVQRSPARGAQAAPPGAAPRVPAAGSRLVRAHGTPGEAFAYAHESGDLAQAGRIALAYRDEFARRGQSESVRLWLERCTEEEIASDPQLSIAAAWVFGYLGDAARARRFVAAAERGPLDVASADGASSLRSALANLRTALAPDGIPQMLRDAELVYASEKQAGTRWLVSGCRAMGVAYVLLGRPQEAITVLREALALFERPTRARPRAGLQSRLSGLRGRRDGQSARRATMGGRSDLAGRRRTPRRDGLQRDRLHGRSARAPATR